MILLIAAAFGCELPSAAPQEVGLDPKSVTALIRKARESDSDAFVLLKDGKFIGGFGATKPHLIFSITKAVTGLAAGRLFADGVWSNLDAPLSELLPQFAGDPKAAVTLRQLMTHTSGIRDVRDSAGHVLPEWNRAPDWVEAARKLPLETAPGTQYRYNNQGPALVAAAVERATGKRMDLFLRETVFEPLCIRKFEWQTDKAGHAAGYTGLSISALDLAKLGQLVLNRGKWRGRQILSEAWIQRSALSPGSPANKDFGLLWMIRPNAALPLPLVSGHHGDGGQHLYVFPNHGIVVARLRGGGESAKEKHFSDLAQATIDLLIQRK